MDFDDNPEEAAFRLRSRAWLDAHATLRRTDQVESSRNTRPKTRDEDERSIDAAKEWQRTKAADGWAAPHWPEAYGGQGVPGRLAAVFREEEARYDVPGNAFIVGVDMAGPTIMKHGSETQRERFLAPMLTGDEVWCQLFSEPGAGSDLAALTTRAEVDGDDFVVNGQKVWTSGAHYSDWGILLARTDWDVPKHRGISYFLLDMRSAGVDVRPLRQIDGAIHFNEVFLSDVRIPAGNLLGEVNAGWGVAMTTLTHERAAISGSSMVTWQKVLALANHLGVTEDPLVRQGLADLHTRFELLRFLRYRIRTATSQGRSPGAESSVIKLAISGMYETAGNLIMSMMGASGTLWGADALYAGTFQDIFLAQWAPRIGGGTDQVQRNVIGERVLGLPPEDRTDKALPFRDVLAGQRGR